MSEVTEGRKAPEFTLPADGGREVSLSDFKGKAVVLYFYPKDDTPGCTKEAIGFSEAAEAFASAGAVVIGLSKDTVAKHDKFRDKHELKVTSPATPTMTSPSAMAPGWKSKCTARPIWALNAAPS